jgi:hypothetical protein
MPRADIPDFYRMRDEERSEHRHAAALVGRLDQRQARAPILAEQFET